MVGPFVGGVLVGTVSGAGVCATSPARDPGGSSACACAARPGVCALVGCALLSADALPAAVEVVARPRCAAGAGPGGGGVGVRPGPVVVAARRGLGGGGQGDVAVGARRVEHGGVRVGVPQGLVGGQGEQD